MRFMAACALAALVAGVQTPAGQAPYRTLDDRFDPPRFTVGRSVETLAPRYLREHILVFGGPVADAGAAAVVRRGSMATC